MRRICSKDPRIKLINKKNEGASSARNTGLEIATGDYTLFLDSDDYVDAEGLDKLYATAIKRKCRHNYLCLYQEDEYSLIFTPKANNHFTILRF